MGGIVASPIQYQTILLLVSVVCAVGEVIADMLPYGHPPLVTQVQHVASLLLPPLTPPVRSSMLNGNITKPVPDLPVGCPDAKGVQVWGKLNASSFVVCSNLVVDPVNFLQVVLVVLVRVRPIVLKPAQLMGVQEGRYSKCVLNTRMIILCLLNLMSVMHSVI